MARSYRVVVKAGGGEYVDVVVTARHEGAARVAALMQVRREARLDGWKSLAVETVRAGGVAYVY